MKMSYEQLEAAYAAQQYQLTKADDAVRAAKSNAASLSESLNASKRESARLQVQLTQKNKQNADLREAHAKAIEGYRVQLQDLTNKVDEVTTQMLSKKPREVRLQLVGESSTRYATAGHRGEAVAPPQPKPRQRFTRATTRAVYTSR